MWKLYHNGTVNVSEWQTGSRVKKVYHALNTSFQNILAVRSDKYFDHKGPKLYNLSTFVVDAKSFTHGDSEVNKLVFET